MSCEKCWKGVPISEIIGSQLPWGAPEFPLVTPSANHNVLYHISSIGDRPPKPFAGREVWDGEHVRMPCSSKSLYPVEEENGDTKLRKRWDMIVKALHTPIYNSQDLARVILSYNSNFKNKWKFRSLHALFNHLNEDEAQYFFNVTLPQISKLALELPKLIQAPLPLLKQHKNQSISLSQQQIASLLANAFFCTFPRRNSTKNTSEYSAYPHINFSSLYECGPSNDILEKLKCLCHYFRRVCTKAPVGVVTVTRRSVAPRNCPKWAHSRVHMPPFHVHPLQNIEDACGLLQVDFANKYLGGGVLGHGSVQEEIRFVICPELMVTMLFTEVLRPNEAILIIGCERFSKYVGYSRSFQWTGDHNDETPFDSSGRRRTAVLAIDALPYSSTAREFQPEMITRELNKAWVGFSFYTDDGSTLQYPGVATGNWGCGAFGGTPELKSLIQIMACAQARRPLAYYTFGDVDLRDEIIAIYNLLCRYNVTVGQLYQFIMRFCETDIQRSDLHAFLQQIILDKEKSRVENVPEQMDFSEPILEPIHSQQDQLQKEINNSPDLFLDEFSQSQDSDLDKIMMTDLPAKQSREIIKVTDHKTDNANKNSQTTRLFEEIQKFDEDNGKLNLSLEDNSLCRLLRTNEKTNPSTSRKEDYIHKTADADQKAANDVVIAIESASNLQDRAQSDVSSNSISAPSTPRKNTSLNVSMDSNYLESVTEVKKKKNRKITDYFTKK